jgi:hypothetical protein
MYHVLVSHCLSMKDAPVWFGARLGVATVWFGDVCVCVCVTQS